MATTAIGAPGNSTVMPRIENHAAAPARAMAATYAVTSTTCGRSPATVNVSFDIVEVFQARDFRSWTGHRNGWSRPALGAKAPGAQRAGHILRPRPQRCDVVSRTHHSSPAPA